MIENRDIVIFGDDWGRFPSTIQHIGRILSEKNRILWIGSLGLRKPEFKFKDLKRIYEKARSIFKKKEIINDKAAVIELHPFILPFHDNKFIRSLNKYFLINAIRKKIKELNFTKPILLTSSPIVGKLIGYFGESSSHYLCLDDYTLFEGAFKSLTILENDLLKKVDSCFSVSKVLMENRIPTSGKNYFLPQGVDTLHFNINQSSIPDSVKSLKKPVIGFFGLLAPWIDIELVSKAAIKYPEYSFLIIGKKATEISNLESISNLKYIGEVPYTDLPKYAKCFDVGLIPFKVNDLTIAANPIKLLEYLSIGIPVVSTKLPEVEKFKDFIFVAENEDIFLNLIKDAVNDNNMQRNHLRMKEAEKYSWYTITELVADKIIEIENEK